MEGDGSQGPGGGGDLVRGRPGEGSGTFSKSPGELDVTEFFY